MNLIEAQGLTQRYGSKVVLDNLDFFLPAGQVLGLIGPNGSGKTTLIQSLLGLNACEGSVRVLGQDPLRERASMLQEVAYVADVAVMPRWLRVEQAVAYLAGVHPRFSEEKAQALLRRSELPQRARVRELSKGMLAQLHLALILAIEARLYILDEPTLGLDAVVRKRFYQDLLETGVGPDKSILITSHQIEEVEPLLTHTAFLQNGQVLLQESLESLRARFLSLEVAPEYRETAQTLQPLYTQNYPDRTTLLFEGKAPHELESWGAVQPADLATIFVATLDQHASQ
jgi:ABC-2 type transport system ATP-binding protein